MGLATLVQGGLRLLGLGGTAAATRTAGGGILSTIGRALTGPAGQGLAGGLAGGAIGSQLFGGGDGGPLLSGAGLSPQLAQIQAAGGQITMLQNGQTMAIAPNGDMQIFNRNGEPRRPSMIIPAGQPLPSGAIVVATRNNGSQIGIVKRRRRRQFGTMIRQVRGTVRAAQALVNLCQPKKRRA